MGRAKNVVFLVGDGMGASTLTASRIFKGQRRGNQGEEEQLIWDTFPAVAMAKVGCWSRYYNHLIKVFRLQDFFGREVLCKKKSI